LTKTRFIILALSILWFSPSCFSYSNSGIEKELCLFYGLPQGQQVRVHEYGSVQDLPPEHSSIPPYAAGAAIPETGDIFIFSSKLGTYPFGSLEQVYAHELSHVYLYRATGMRVPRWFDEGMAMQLSGDWGGRDDLYLALALPWIAHGKITIESIEKDFREGESSSRRSYAVSRAFVRDIFKYRGDMQEFILLVREKRSFEKAFQQYFDLPSGLMFERWAKKLPWWGPLYSMAASASFLWFLVVLLFLLASLVTLIRRRQWKKKWEEEEALEKEKLTIQ